MCEQSVLNVLNLEEKKSKYGSPASYPKRKEDLKILPKKCLKKKKKKTHRNIRHTTHTYLDQ